MYNHIFKFEKVQGNIVKILSSMFMRLKQSKEKLNLIFDMFIYFFLSDGFLFRESKKFFDVVGICFI